MLLAPPKIDWTHSALFLDVDGTLLEIEQHPDDVHADDELVEMLRRTSQLLDGALALISGRAIADLDRIFAPAQFVAVGTHGAEWRKADGSVVERATATIPQSVSDEAIRFADNHRGLMMEPKRHGFALHFRQAPHLETECREIMRIIVKNISSDFRLIEGKMVLELTPSSYDKGEAVKELLEDQPFSGRMPVYLGDDVTDEDGFRMTNRKAGISIRVGADTRTEAIYSLESVAVVRRWLVGISEQFPQNCGSPGG